MVSSAIGKERWWALLISFLVMIDSFLIFPTAAISSEDGIEFYETIISTNGGGIPGRIALEVYQPKADGKFNAFVMCPGSWEPSEAWGVYFPPFTPEFIAGQGYVVICWDPRGSFMAGAAASEALDYLDPDRWGIGESSIFPPAIMLMSEVFVEDLYEVITFANNLEKVKKDEIGIIGFSHGASYPIAEKVLMQDDRVKLIAAIEPLADERSLIAMATSSFPPVMDAATHLFNSIPHQLIDLIWSALSHLGIVGLPSHFIEDLDCDLIVVQSEQYHASLSGMLGLGSCREPGLTLYNSAVNARYRKLNRNPPGIAIDETNLDDYDWFPSPLWDDGELLCQYFVECIEPRVVA